MKRIKEGAVKKNTGPVYRSDTTPPKGPGKMKGGMKANKMAGSRKCEY